MSLYRFVGFLTRPVDWRLTVTAGPCLVCVLLYAFGCHHYFRESAARSSHRVGPDRFKVVDGKEYLLATSPRDETKEWFDITGSPLDKTRFQYGIGRDTIPSIDDPVFVAPDDSRLLALSRENITKTADLRVIGFAAKGAARAYPIGLLDHHELVNDTLAGKPITVGW